MKDSSDPNRSSDIILSPAAVGQFLFLFCRICGVSYRAKAEDKMTVAVRMMDEELAINLKCIFGVLMTGLALRE